MTLELPINRRGLPKPLDPPGCMSPSADSGMSPRSSAGSEKTTHTAYSNDVSSSSADSGWELFTLEEFTKTEALALQRALLERFEAPTFQRDLRELADAHRLESGKSKGYRVGFMRLVRREQMKVLPHFGFEASELGVEAMLRAFAEWKNDSDIQVQEKIIQDTLRSAEPVVAPAEPQKNRLRMKPSNKFGIECFLQALLKAFTEPWFQEKIYELRRSADYGSGRAVRKPDGSQTSGPHSVDPEGYYNLSGRAALALQVHEQVLPRYWFEGTPEGVQEMLLHVSPYLGDKDVARVFDAINSKLGMEPNAQQRFRRLVALAEDVDVQVLWSCSPRRRAASNSPSPRRERRP
ncbi:unnamed protein product [Effrenium voratum]|uniref:Uncharacterized protein n=1 Tax=Effrenium voratum TaxID=2562239 RepID=A0AA36I3Q6_9DINO|nr:unnamed protein product [Effrenium voratum]